MTDADTRSQPEDPGREPQRDRQHTSTADNRRKRDSDDQADPRDGDDERSYTRGGENSDDAYGRRRRQESRRDADENGHTSDADGLRRSSRDDERSRVRQEDQAERRADEGRRPPTGDADQRRSRPGNGGQDDRRDDRGDDQHQGRHRRWPLIILAVVVVLAIIGAVAYWWLTRNEQSTDDAYTEGNAVSFASQVTGYVTQLNINDNMFVHKGDLLLRIDQRTYVAARDQAKAALDLARAQLSSAQVSLEITRVSAPSNLLQAKAQLAQVQANRSNAQREYNRQKSVDPRATTQNSIDQANFQFRAQDAQVQAAQAQLDTASLVQQNIHAAEDTVKQRQAQVEQAEANLESAEVNLSYTELRAPEDGYITRRNVDLGTFLQAGQQVFYIVTPKVWVVANFKETQLGRMRPGQQVSITVDAYPQLKLHGHIDSVQQGSGARFSAFPAENATGNFVKIVRRVPVKIVIDSGLPQGVNVLPFGLSCVPTVELE